MKSTNKLESKQSPAKDDKLRIEEANPFLAYEFEELFNIPFNTDVKDNSSEEEPIGQQAIESIDDINQLPSPASGDESDNSVVLSDFIQSPISKHESQNTDVDSVERNIDQAIVPEDIRNINSVLVTDVSTTNFDVNNVNENNTFECQPDVTIFDDILNDTDDVISLREAIIAANFEEIPVDIHLCAGTYTLSILGLNENNAATGDLDIHGDITLIGEDVNTTIIDAAQIDRLFQILPHGQLTLKNVTLTGGEAYQFSGGAILNEGQLVLDNVILENNHARLGGAIYNTNDLFISQSEFSNNHAILNGGALYNTGVNSQTEIIQTNWHHNEASGYGGAIANQLGTLNINQSTVHHNETDYIGGGLINLYGALTLQNSTISNNHANITGGGMINLFGQSFSISHATITENDSLLNGAGVYNIQPNSNNALTIFSTVIGNNVGDYDIAGSQFQSLGHNLIGNLDGAVMVALPTDQIGSLVANQVIDAHLAPLTDNGGFAQTHALLGLSPAIDAGNALDSLADQRGVAVVGVKDIGAFEFEGQSIQPLVAPTPLLLMPLSLPSFMGTSPIQIFPLNMRDTDDIADNAVNISDVLSDYSDPATFDMMNFLQDLENYYDNYLPSQPDANVIILPISLPLHNELSVEEPPAFV